MNMLNVLECVKSLATYFGASVLRNFQKIIIEPATFTMGAYSIQELIEFCSNKNDEGLPILRAFCGSAIITNVLRSHGRILRRTRL